jgi:transposase
MKINQAQYDKIKHILPTQRGNVTIDNLTLINALLYILENGCKWRRLPSEFGYWHAIYMRFSRWVKNGVIEKMFKELHVQNILRIKSDALMMDSTTIKVHPDACGALKKVVSNASDALRAG